MGTQVWIYQSSYNRNIKFTHWTKNGEYYSDQESFTYTVPNSDTKFVAHYKYEPASPEEPTVRYSRKLFLSCTPTSAGSLNYSSENRVMVDDYIYLYPYINQGYRFLGWYEGEALVSSDKGFYYQMPDRDVSLVAKFKFDPTSPADPSTFYSTSCSVVVESNDLSKGTVTVEGLQDGRAVFGSRITLKASPVGGNTFYGWTDGENIISKEPEYTYTVTDKKAKLHFVAHFSYLRGDADSNGSVNNNDIYTLANHLLGIPVATFDPLAADASQDEKISVADIPALVKIIRR